MEPSQGSKVWRLLRRPPDPPGIFGSPRQQCLQSGSTNDIQPDLFIIEGE